MSRSRISDRDASKVSSLREQRWMEWSEQSRRPAMAKTSADYSINPDVLTVIVIY
jgi:hypothetical protein